MPTHNEFRFNEFRFRASQGVIAIGWNDQGKLTHIDWSADLVAEQPVHEMPACAAELAARLIRYFAGGQPITEVPWDDLDRSSWSDFQERVYRAIVDIPHGETRTYAWVAMKIGKWNATRAVGQALRNNPFPVLIPCHRVVAASSLGGFMGKVDPEDPELKLKSALLGLEDLYRQPIFHFLYVKEAALGGVRACG